MQETVNTLFDYAIELERAAETLYKEMAELFSDEPQVMSFWLRYAEEEKGHAAYLQRARDEMSADELSKPANENILRDARRCLRDAEAVDLKTIRNLDDAYQLAVEVEGAETNAIFDFMLSNFSTGELAKSYKFLKVQLDMHATKLEREFPDPYKGRAWRKKLLAKRK